jgi:hypothetical protein
VAGARHFTDLIVWKLGDQHRLEVFALTKALASAPTSSFARSSTMRPIQSVGMWRKDSAARLTVNSHDSFESVVGR